MESRDAVLLMPWLVAFYGGEDYRQRDAPQEASEKEKLERASAECRHTGAAKVAARKLVA